VGLEELAHAVLVALIVVVLALIRQLWRLSERVSRLEGSRLARRRDSFD
jgi:hypothetical protein